MVTNSDLQIWQDDVNGINDSGKVELTQEEWTALSVLNGSLNSGNFQSDESRRSIKLIQDYLSTHSNNTALQFYLQDFIDLCYKYGASNQTYSVVPASTDLNTYSREDLQLVLSTARDEVVKYTDCCAKVENLEKLINGEKEKLKSNKFSTGCLFVFAVINTVITLFTFVMAIDVNNLTPIILFLFFISVISAIAGIVTNSAKKVSKRKIMEYENQIPFLKKKEEDAMNEFNATLLIPEEYCYEYALITMLQYIENKRASNWERVTDLYEEHLHRMTVEENTQIAAEQARIQTEIARKNLSATRWAAAGSIASAAGIWRINSKL